MTLKKVDPFELRLTNNYMNIKPWIGNMENIFFAYNIYIEFSLPFLWSTTGRLNSVENHESCCQNLDLINSGEANVLYSAARQTVASTIKCLTSFWPLFHLIKANSVALEFSSQSLQSLGKTDSYFQNLNL